MLPNKYTALKVSTKVKITRNAKGMNILQLIASLSLVVGVVSPVKQALRILRLVPLNSLKADSVIAKTVCIGFFSHNIKRRLRK